jgi:hypothetical protein
MGGRKDKIFCFRPRISGANSSFSLDDDIAEFSPRLTTMAQVEVMRGWDLTKSKPLSAKRAPAGRRP